MSNAVSHKGYFACINFNRRDNIFVGHVLGVDDKISFHDSTVDELMSDFHATVDHYLSDCEESGRKPQ